MVNGLSAVHLERSNSRVGKVMALLTHKPGQTTLRVIRIFRVFRVSKVSRILLLNLSGIEKVE